MILDKIIKKIEDLRHNTNLVLKEVQECKVPALYKMTAEVQQTYFIDGQEFVYNDGRLILLIKNLPIYYNLKRTIFTDYIANMVTGKELHPFLIFLNGKFIKWSNIKLVHDFKDRYILIENFDLSSCYVPMSKTASMEDIFNTWERFSHNTYGTFPANVNELSQWIYNPATEAVECSINSTTYIGFISDKKYSDYVHQVTITSVDPDDDIIGTVIAFHKDETGKEHTLSAIRCPGTTNGGMLVNGILAKWMIVYNYGQSNQKLIIDGSRFITNATGTGWAALPRGCTIKIERAETTVYATTSQFNSNTLDPMTKLSIDLTSDPVLQLFVGPKQYGYSCYSQNKSTFKDLSFIDLKDNIILPEPEMVILPFNIKYNENQSVLSPNNIFAFDESGFCVTSLNGQSCTVDLDDPYIYYESNYLTPGKVQSTGINPNYKISETNPLIFKNGKLYSDRKIDFYGLNTFLVDDGGYYVNNILYKLFYYIYGNQSKDNILNIPNTTNAINVITSSTIVPTYIEALAEPFDFKFDKNRSYSDNITSALYYIINYNPGLLSDVYKELNKIDVHQYTGTYLLSIVSNTGYITMSRTNKQGLLNYPIIFVNGEIYKYYSYTTYFGNSFTFPIIGIKSTDIVEIIMFKDIDNRILESKIISDNDNIYYLDSNIDIKNLRIFSRDAYNKTFDIPNSDYLRYKVDFSAERIDESRISITLKDSYYYDRTLYFASSRQFRYYYVILKQSIANFRLPKEFAYCQNKNNYMIFINGRKIDIADFQLTNVNKINPFDEISLYIGIPLKANDKIDFFYVPEEISEVAAAPIIPTDGNILIDKLKLPYAFDKDLYFVFMNGKKVSSDSILNIDSHKAKILNNIGTISNLSILRHANDEDTINELFSSNNNIYDSTIDSLSDTDLNMLYSNGNIINNTESHIKTGKIDNSEITKQIIRDYFLRTITIKINSDNLPELISYDYAETIPYVETDSDGNILIK